MKYRLDEAQAGIKITGRNVSYLRYTDDTALMAESKEELKSLLMKLKEESEKAGLKFSIQKIKIMASSPVTSWQIDRKTMETATEYIFLAFKITSDGDFSHEIKRHSLLGGLPRWLGGQESSCNVRDAGWIPGSGRSPGGGNGNPL